MYLPSRMSPRPPNTVLQPPNIKDTVVDADVDADKEGITLVDADAATIVVVGEETMVEAGEWHLALPQLEAVSRHHLRWRHKCNNRCR